MIIIKTDLLLIFLVSSLLSASWAMATYPWSVTLLLSLGVGMSLFSIGHGIYQVIKYKRN